MYYLVRARQRDTHEFILPLPGEATIMAEEKSPQLAIEPVEKPLALMYVGTAVVLYASLLTTL